MLRRILSSPFCVARLPVLVAGLLITAVLFNLTFRLEQERVDLDFCKQAKIYIANVRQSFSDAITSLEAFNLLFSTVDVVTPDEFRRFARQLLTRYPMSKPLPSIVWHR